MAIRRTGWPEVGSPREATALHGAGEHALRRFSTARHTGAFWAALWAAAVAAELGALVPVVFDNGTPVDGLGIISRLLGGSFAACGLIAWRRRPDSRAGQLMTATGFALFIVPLLTQLHAPLAQTAAMQLTEVWTVLFVALILTSVSGGRLRSQLDWLLIAAFVLPLIVLQFVWLLFEESQTNVLDVFADARIADAVDKGQRSLFAAAALATAAVVALRWLRSSAPRRRALLPGVAGVFCLLLIVGLLINDLVTGARPQWLTWAALASTLLVPGMFLAGLLRSRLARGGLAALFRGLGTARGAELQSALARALGDPSLVVAYRLAGSLGYADADGRAVMVPPPTRDRACAPVEWDGRAVAVLVYDASLDDDPELVEAVCAAGAIALENERLHGESAMRLTELRASRERIVAAGDAERRRLERNLHDGAQQRLVAIALQLRLLQGQIRNDPATAERLAATAGIELGESLDELRELARGLHPAVLDYGLASAVRSVATRSAVATEVSIETSESFPEPVALAAYFVVCEALANVGKYSRATVAQVRVFRRGALACVEIADDGVGGADVTSGSGLRGLMDRVEALGGRLHVTSAPGAGTVVTAELPCSGA